MANDTIEGFQLQRQATAMMTTDPAAIAAAEAVKARIQSAYIMAMQRPRNEAEARDRILAACRRPGFAKKAEFSKPIGGDDIAGPTIRFAELAMREWGNILAEVTTLYEDERIRRVRVSTLDLETNAQFSRDLQVKKTIERRSKRNRESDLVGERINSYGKKVFILKATEEEMQTKESSWVSKTLRNEGLRLIPYDVKEEALAVARETIRKKIEEDPDREKKNLFDSFSGLGIGPAELERYIRHAVDTISPAELANLRTVYEAIRSGESTWADYVDNATPSPPPPPPGGSKKDAGNGHSPDSDQKRQPPPPNTDRPRAPLDIPTENADVETFDTIEAAYSADMMADSGKIRTPFVHSDVLRTTTGITTSPMHGKNAETWRLTPTDEYQGPTFSYAEMIAEFDKNEGRRGDHTGQLVSYRGRGYVLSHPIRFHLHVVSNDEDGTGEPESAYSEQLTQDEFQRLLDRLTLGNRPHELIREWLDFKAAKDDFPHYLDVMKWCIANDGAFLDEYSVWEEKKKKQDEKDRKDAEKKEKKSAGSTVTDPEEFNGLAMTDEGDDPLQQPIETPVVLSDCGLSANVEGPFDGVETAYARVKALKKTGWELISSWYGKDVHEGNIKLQPETAPEYQPTEVMLIEFTHVPKPKIESKYSYYLLGRQVAPCVPHCETENFKTRDGVLYCSKCNNRVGGPPGHGLPDPGINPDQDDHIQDGPGHEDWDWKTIKGKRPGVFGKNTEPHYWTGFGQYIIEHRETWPVATPDQQAKAIKKWDKNYKGYDFPIDRSGAVLPAYTSPAEAPGVPDDDAHGDDSHDENGVDDLQSARNKVLSAKQADSDIFMMATKNLIENKRLKTILITALSLDECHAIITEMNDIMEIRKLNNGQ